MRITSPAIPLRFSTILIAGALSLPSLQACADAVTDWNDITIKATKGFNGTAGIGATLNSNVASRIEAIEARAVFDAVNSIDHFSVGSYYYSTPNTGSAAAAAAQAAHDVVYNQLPSTAQWQPTRDWLDAQLSTYLTNLGVASSDPGILAGQASAAAALLARSNDNANPGTSYGATLTPTSNPGIGVWRESNAGPGVVSPSTGAPTGFDGTGAIVGAAGINLNWRDVIPFSLTYAQKVALVASVPLSPQIGSPEYVKELDYVKNYGEDTSALRSADQTAQALYYKIDAELFINEAARIASSARGYTLDQNAKLFALLDSAVADARFAAFDSKYEQKFWRAVTALNANPDGSVTNGYTAWRPLAATPSHPGNTAGHSTTGAAGFEILRSFFGDKIKPDGSAVTLGTLPWLTGTNAGTGVNTSRQVTTFSQAQLENGASRLYLGVHFGFDNVQGQLLGLAVADTILVSSDPAAAGLSIVSGTPASPGAIKNTLRKYPATYGYFGLSTINAATPTIPKWSDLITP
jgi:hypothetical protein